MQTSENTPIDADPGPVVQLVRWVGVVQGVGFRALVRAEALRDGVSGWVRNRSDGSVEATLAGGALSVAEFVKVIARARQGAIRETVTRSLDPSSFGSLGRFFIAPTSGIDAFPPCDGGGDT